MARLDDADCRERFAAARVARLATAGADRQPHLVPITFVLVADRIFTAVDHKPKATTRLRRLRNIAENAAVSLLVDRYDDDWSRLWWVRADGVATVLMGGRDRGGAVDALVGKYPQYRGNAPRGPVIAVNVTAWSGWSYG